MDGNTLLAIGFAGALVVIAISYSNWRWSVKAALVVVLIEGVLRKWIVPQASDLVYFLKDIILIGAYLKYYQEPRIPWAFRWPYSPASLATLCVGLLGLCVFHPNVGSMLAGMLGFKNYVMYIPLFFMVPDLFRSREQFKRELSCYLLLGIPICLLGLAQWRSDSFSVLNTYSQGTETYGATTFGTSQHVRITGSFSYLTGHTVFCCVFFGLTIAILSMSRVPFRAVHATLGVPLLLVNGLMSGSRAAVLVQLAIICAAILQTGILKTQHVQRLILTLLICGIASAAAGFLLFPDAIEASVARFQLAGDSIADRTVAFTGKFINAGVQDGGVMGFGIGSTSPAVASLRRILALPYPESVPVPYDFEMGQIIVELGVFAAAMWYTLRFAVELTIFRSFLQVNDQDIKPLLLCVLVVTVPFFFMSLVLNHVAGILIWTISGFALWRQNPWHDGEY